MSVSKYNIYDNDPDPEAGILLWVSQEHDVESRDCDQSIPLEILAAFFLTVDGPNLVFCIIGMCMSMCDDRMWVIMRVYTTSLASSSK